MVNQVVSIAVITIVLLGMLSIVYVSWRNGISPMPSSWEVRRMVVAEIKRLSVQGLIVEAGSGWGTLALDIAAQCPDRQLIGVENSPIPLGVSRLAARWVYGEGQASSHVRFIKGDLYEYPYKRAGIVITYLYPDAMKRLNRILHDSLTPSTALISVCFAMPGWRPERVLTCKDAYRTKVYVYIRR